MKNQFVFITCLLLHALVTAQEPAIETKSVTIDNLIPFIVDTIENKDEEDYNDSEHFVFLVQAPIGDLTGEDKVILKQAFSLVSQRLTAGDKIAIVAYTGSNGIVLKMTSPKDLKEIIYAVEHFKSNIKELHKDGIELAYTYAKAQANEETASTVVMIRNPKAMIAGSSANMNTQKTTVTDTSKKGNAVLLTAITLLPQIISVIKD